MPNNNTTQQAIFLDQWREEAEWEREEGLDEERTSKKIRIELNGCWIDVRVDVHKFLIRIGIFL